MSVCKRCGAEFGCAMADGGDGGPCWCTAMPPAVPVPSTGADVTCWCPACLKLHIENKRPGGIGPNGSDPDPEGTGGPAPDSAK